MPLNRVKVWDDDDVPTADDLNAEFDNICSKFSNNITPGDADTSSMVDAARFIDASDYTTLTEAIAAADAADKDLWIPSGEYGADTTPIVVPANMRVTGAGPGEVTIQPASGYAYPHFFILGNNSEPVSNVLEGFTLVPPDSYGAISAFTFIRVQSYVDGRNNVLIENIDIDLDSDASVERTGIYLSSMDTDNNPLGVEGCIIRNCNIYAEESDAGTSYGIQVLSCTHFLVEHCVFTSMVYPFYTASISVKSCGMIQHCVFKTYDVCIKTMRLYRNIYAVFNYIEYMQAADSDHIGIELIEDGNRVEYNHFNASAYDPGTYGIYCGVYASYRTTIRHNGSNDTGHAFGSAFIYMRYDGAELGFNYSLASTVYGGGYVGRARFTKTWNGYEPLVMDDVVVWLYYTGTTNYLNFKKGVPSSATDADAYIVLSGTTSLL